MAQTIFDIRSYTFVVMLMVIYYSHNLLQQQSNLWVLHIGLRHKMALRWIMEETQDEYLFVCVVLL